VHARSGNEEAANFADTRRGEMNMVEPTLCHECGHEASAQARFCERCGAELGSSAEPLRAPDALAEKIRGARREIEGERKQVTVLFADIVSSMELTRSLETERWGAVLKRFLAIASGPIHEVEGTVNQFTGDGLMAVFGAPLAHEDHARRACLAALDLQSELKPFAEELASSDQVEFSVRCGLNSGEVIVGSVGEDLRMDFAPIGNTSGLAKRMESLAPEGSTALSASTAALVEGEFELRELGEFDVKGMSERQRVLELVGRGPARSRLEAAESRGLSRFVGREAEREKLDSALEQALASEGQVMGIVGDPGVGKSRLCRELVRSCRERGLTINSGSAVAHGRSVPLLPVLAMFRDLFGIEESDGAAVARERIESALAALDADFDPDLPLIFDFLSVPDPARPLGRIDPEARQRRLLAFLDRLVQARSAREPAVIVIEDLHWIDEASAVFVEELVGAVEGTRTLLVTTFRPEYSAEWMENPVAEELSLAPLATDAAGEMLAGLLGDHPSLDGLDELIQARTEGNPFFIEEVVQALAETGHLAGERGDYRLAAPLEDLVLPPTVQAVLGARIDRLAPREKSLVQTMSVIGKEVPEPILCEVSELPEPELAEAVEALAAAEFLNEARSNGQRELAFKHPLTQEVAYGSQLSEPRARAHAAVAEAIEQVYEDGLDERAALLAHHSEAAGETLKAAQWHARAAAWVAVSSPADGMRHWRRVRELTDDLDDLPEAESLAIMARIQILGLAWRLGMSHEETGAIHAEGRMRTGGNVPAEATPAAAGTEDSERALLDAAYATNLHNRARELQSVDHHKSACRRAEAVGDPGLMLPINGQAAYALLVTGNVREGFDLVNRALEFAGDDVTAGSGLMYVIPYAHCLWARGYTAGLLGQSEQAARDLDRSIALGREHDDPEAECFAMGAKAILLGQTLELVDFKALLDEASAAAKLAEASGNPAALATTGIATAIGRIGCGDAAGAEADAARVIDVIRETGVDPGVLPLLLAVRAQARALLGRTDDALADAQESVAMCEKRGLRPGSVVANLALARVRMWSEGADASEVIESALERALELAHEIEARLLEPQIHIELAALARLRGDEEAAKRKEAEAERLLEEIRAPAEPPASEAQDPTVDQVLMDAGYAATLFWSGREQEGLDRMRSGVIPQAEATGDAGLVVTMSAGASWFMVVMGELREARRLAEQGLANAGDDLECGAGLLFGSPVAFCLANRALITGYMGQLQEAERGFERAIELAVEHDDPEIELVPRTHRTFLLARIGDFGTARQDAERSLEIAEQHGSGTSLTTAYGIAAIECLGRQDFDAAEQNVERALNLIREQDFFRNMEPYLLALLAEARLGLGRAEDARTAAEEATQMSARRGLKAWEVMAQVTHARILTSSDGSEAHQAAHAALVRALELARETGALIHEPAIHTELATLAGLRGDKAEAEREEAEAERILAEIREPDRAEGSDDDGEGAEHDAERVLLDMAFASTLFFGARERESLDPLRSASSRAIELQDPGLALTTSVPAGAAAWALGRAREGAELIDRALAMAGDDVLAGSGLIFGCPYAHCLWVRGVCVGYLGSIDAALRDFARSIELAREHGDLECECAALSARAFQRSEILGLESALEDGERSLEIADQTGNATAQLSANAILARVRANVGDFGGSREAAERALVIVSKQQTGLHAEADIHSALARALRGLGLTDEAVAAARKSVAIAEKRSLKRGSLMAHLELARALMRASPDDITAIEAALDRTQELVRETESHTHGPQIHTELAALARLHGDEAAAKCEEAEAERLLEEFGARQLERA
jgi:class 3 adenylate cyclase/tetratricopeptide (TPR) repeat protein